MKETEQLRVQVQARIEGYLSARASILAQISPELAPFSRFSQEFLSGGKRFRATFAFWGWHGVTEAADPALLSSPDALAEITGVASAIEVFHAAALVHDDIIDNSDTRRGEPALHRRFEALAAEGGWDGEHREFGIGSAILFGDMLLCWSDELLNETVDSLADRAAARAVRTEYSGMRTDVTAGQYLDVLEESAWRGHSDEELIERARRILTYKSAKYSVEVPLALGAHTAGAGAAQLEALRAYGLAVGMAFQLRDDVLGVFGDASVTGKPSGDDLREGKRTLLVALTRRELGGAARDAFDAQVGDPGLTEAQIARLQETMRRTGAVEAVENIIASSIRDGQRALEGAPLGARAVTELTALAERVSARAH